MKKNNNKKKQDMMQRKQTATAFSNIADAAEANKSFDEKLFGGKKKFEQQDFVDISKNYIKPNACFSLKKHTDGRPIEVANVIAGERGAAYKLLLDELKEKKSYMARIHMENKNSKKMFEKLGFVPKKKQTEKNWVTYIRSKQIMEQKNKKKKMQK